MLRQLRLQLLARAVQPGHDGAHWHPQRLRDLDVAFMLNMKERNHLAVARRQRGDGALQVALRFLFLDPLLAGDGEVVGKLRSDAGRGSVVAPALRGQRQHRPAAAKEIDAVVPRDSQDPGGEGLARIEIADSGVGADERLLGSVARLFSSAKEPEAETVDGLLVLLHEARERGLVTAGSVETSASESQPRCGSANFRTHCAASSTKGTLLTIWQAATVNTPKRTVCCVASEPSTGASAEWMRSAIPAWATPWVTTKSPA